MPETVHITDEERSSAGALACSRLAGVCLVILVVTCVTWVGQTSAVAASVIERIAPVTISMGSTFTVTNIVAPGEEVLVYLLEEDVPPGWGVSRVSSRGTVDVELGKIKWGPFFDRIPRQFTYQLTPPEKTRGDVDLTGRGAFNGDTTDVSGVTRIRLEPLPGVKLDNFVESLIPARYMAGGTIILTNRVTLSDDALVYLVEDRVPPGWGVGAINHGGQFDPATRKIKWGPYSDRVERDLWCELRPPAETTNTVRFSGVGSFDGKEVVISGRRESQPIVSTVVSELPVQFKANDVVTVSLTVAPLNSTTVYLVEDFPPAGWQVRNISNDGTFDPRTGAIKWGPFFSNQQTKLTYQVVAPAVITNTVAVFAGTSSFNGQAFAISGSRQMPALVSRALRQMPPEFIKSSSFEIIDRIIPEPSAQVYVVEDEVPSGWQVSEISHDGTYDTRTRKVKWGPFLDAEERELRFTVTPPSNVAQLSNFRGVVSVDGRNFSITGQQQARPASPDSLHKIVRSMPATVRAGRSVVVTNQIAPGPGIKLQSFEDTIPKGWEAKVISHEGTFDSINGKVKWGPFFDTENRSLTYELVPAKTANGPAELRGVGSFNDDLVVIGGQRAILAIANYAPFAKEDIFQRVVGKPLNFTVRDILANDSDPDGDPITFIEVDRTGKQGGSISIVGETVTYMPPSGSDPEDTFNYRIHDGLGGSNTGVIRINVITEGPSGNRVSLEPLPNGVVRLRFAGIPGRRYLIQSTDSIQQPNWVTIGSATASIRGDFELEDLDAPNHRSRFYRTVTP